MRFILVLACLLVACEFTAATSSRRVWDPRTRSYKSHSDKYKGPSRGCGGRGQVCCKSSLPCHRGYQCKVVGESSWFSASGRCVPPQKQHRCGQEGMDCCRTRGQSLCFRGLDCAANMCRKPSSAVDIKPMPGVVGQTTASASGWIMVKVLARGGKCFVRVRGNLVAQVETFGEGTFGEVFGDLSAMGECTDDAEGFGIGYIRVESISTATLTQDGECISDGTSTAVSNAKVKGEGITIGVGGSAGGVVGCNRRRRLRILDFVPF